MPERITKDEAIERVAGAVPEGACAMCHLYASARPILSSRRARAFLNRFPTRWGHVLVLAERHVTSFNELSEEEHADASALLFAAARRIEERLGPARVFTACLGTALAALPMSSPHLHWHVVPTGGGERPADVFTWSHGIWTGSDAEWADLYARLAEPVTAS